MELEVYITEDVLLKSARCPRDSRATECAIAIAIRDIFPDSIVGTHSIIFEESDCCKMIATAALPEKAIRFIRDFDAASPVERAQMRPFKFKFEIPPVVIKTIDISEVTETVKKSPVLNIIHKN